MINGKAPHWIQNRTYLFGGAHSNAFSRSSVSALSLEFINSPDGLSSQRTQNKLRSLHTRHTRTDQSLTDSSCSHHLYDFFDWAPLTNASKRAMIGNNAFEGGFSPDPEVNTTIPLSQWIAGILLNSVASVVDQLTNVVYLPVSTSPSDLLTSSPRKPLFLGESVFECNALSLSEVFADHSYAYD